MNGRPLAMVLALVVAACGGAPASTASLAPTVAPPTVAPTDDFAATACRLTDDLNTIQNDYMIPLAGLLGDWVAALGQPIPASQSRQALGYVKSAGDIIVKDTATITALKSAEHPALVVNITKAFTGYASGMMTLGPVLSDPNGSTDLSTIVTGTEQLNAARMALNDANDEVDLMVAAGATCG